jgi:hypothetical protein
MSDKSTQKRPLETAFLKTSFSRGGFVLVGAFYLAIAEKTALVMQI